MPQRTVPVSSRLGDVRYEIRGALSRRARELEAEGRQIIRLNIGNPGLFGFSVPAHVRAAVESHLDRSEAYCHQQGLQPAREAIAEREQARGAFGAHADNVFIGNGVSELIDLTLRALLNSGEEVLLPSPDYPLWSAATVLNGGRPRYYPCPASRGHLPDPDEIEALITPRTRALVLVNPNNPTGATYPRELLQALVQVAERHRLLLLSDEIYDNILYDGAEFHPLAALAGETPCITYSGLSKMYRACGYRVGWISLSGTPSRLTEFRTALDLLSALRLCANVPTQWGIAPALDGPDTMAELVGPGGRLHATRQAMLDGVAQSEFLDVVAPQGALYAFPAVRTEQMDAFDDEDFALDLLQSESVLVVPGTGFNIRERNHFRLTLLPQADEMAEVFLRIERCLQRQAARSGRARHVA
ncbi:L-aspartate aminotransferase [Tahibacter aquaticus]|uniref:alanine transaminase n=1 Tax=Tahibacter aquaticus TaxID=520092 RepID=A0A4R6ZAD0_9GAMM|nr:aminotransferase class I/II-fold pyridoxal phosphate-dependent enzyme [Tahibacter aquaticus]TDR48893.1 L-aspartate aminotransferase [Tahibacter aquaticus]